MYPAHKRRKAVPCSGTALFRRVLLRRGDGVRRSDGLSGCKRGKTKKTFLSRGPWQKKAYDAMAFMEANTSASPLVRLNISITFSTGSPL